jgi:flagellar protein FlgJ
MDRLEYIKTFNPVLEKIQQEFAIPTDFGLAQSGIESGFATHAPGFNHFGIKANAAYKGKKQLLKTTEYHNTKTVKYPIVHSITIVKQADGSTKYKYSVSDWFRAYDSSLDSFRDWAKFLKENRRYAIAFKYSDPFKFALEIAKAGYATAPNYYAVLYSVIKNIQDLKKKTELATPNITH